MQKALGAIWHAGRFRAIVDDEILALFKIEAAELIADLETNLLDLEQVLSLTKEGGQEVELRTHASTEDLIARIFRAMHTLKGSGSMVGMDEMSSYVHRVEDLFSLLRAKPKSIQPMHAALGLQALDIIKKMVLEGETPSQQELDASFPWQPENAEEDENPQTHGTSSTGGLVQSINPAQGARSAASGTGSGPGGANMRRFEIVLTLRSDWFRLGLPLLPLFDELRALGEISIQADTSDVPPLDGLNPELIVLFWRIQIITTSDRNALLDCFMFYDDVLTYEIQEFQLDQTSTLTEVQPAVQQDSGTSGFLDQKPALQASMLSAQATGSGTSLPQPGSEAEPGKAGAKGPGGPDWSHIRVKAHKLDELVDTVGELLTFYARMDLYAHASRDGMLIGLSEELERHVRRLRELSMGMHMVPALGLFTSFNRLVRDLAQELGKEVLYHIEPSETELDKNIISALKDPVMHILRNALDHGIETPSQREAAGKHRRGTIHSQASYAGTSVLITISDDGRGLDLDAIQKKGIERGLLEAGKTYTEQQIMACIMEPGFSTARELSTVSGRGVGMDVVKKHIEQLRGHIELESVKGQGTTIRLRIPFTLAIIEGLLVRCQDVRFILPLNNVDRVLEGSFEGYEGVYNLGGEPLAWARLDCLVEADRALSTTQKGRSLVVVKLEEGSRLGLVVDEILEPVQNLIKALQGESARNPCLSGAALLGDGTIALLVDVMMIIREATRRSKTA